MGQVTSKDYLKDNPNAQYGITITLIVLAVVAGIALLYYFIRGGTMNLQDTSSMEAMFIPLLYTIITITYVVLITNGNMASCDSKKESDNNIKLAFSIGIIFIFLLMLYYVGKVFIFSNFDNINNLNIVTTIIPSVCFFMSYSALSLSLIKVTHS
jgi:hypothetical protein